MNEFVFESYDFDGKVASFRYTYGNLRYQESVTFDVGQWYDEAVLERALFLAFLVVGTSYYKAFPSPNVRFETGELDDWQAEFCNKVYQEGLSQFAFENSLTRQDLAKFNSTSQSIQHAVSYDGQGILALQSGGKDSLLCLPERKGSRHWKDTLARVCRVSLPSSTARSTITDRGDQLSHRMCQGNSSRQ
jgi:hypothetical protein